MELGLSGLASGFDWHTLVDKLAEVERAPQRRLRTEQNLLSQRNAAYGNIAAQLGVLKTRVEALKEASLFDSRSTRVGDATVATATAAAGAALGTYSVTIVQLATASAQQGAANVGQALNATNDVSGLVLSEAGFSTAVTAGTFTVNGRPVTLATSDTLQEVFDKINTATSGAVTASYDSATDKITLSSASAIVLGSATDTSNFLAVAKLSNNGTGTVTSSYALGAIKQTAALASANFSTPVSDGGSGAGEFKINGVSIAFNATTDTVADVLARINNSAAGVTASYDATQDRFLLTNKTTGDVGLALEDVSGNFLAASGLSSGALSRGKNLLYTINGGDQLSTPSNTITADSSGITGLSVTALKTGTTTVEVTSDTTKIRTAITDFLTEYNKAQTLIETNTASSTDAKGKVTAGVLAGQSDAFDLAARLRSTANAVVSGLSGTINKLANLGIHSNGTDDTLRLSDSSQLDAALANNLSTVKELFTHATNGLSVKLGAYLDRVVGEDGALVTRQSTLTKQVADIDTQISDQERQVQANRQRLIDSFVVMEQVQARINHQLQFLLQRFSTNK